MSRVTPPEVLRGLEEELASGDACRIARALLRLYHEPVDAFPAELLLERFGAHPDPRVRMAVVDLYFVEAVRGQGEGAGAAEVDALAALLPRYHDDTYVTRNLVNRIVQHRLAQATPLLLSLLPASTRPEWLLTAYGALHPFRGYEPLRDLVRRHPGAAWDDEAMKHLYRLDPPKAVMDFPQYLPGLSDKKLWRVLEALGPEMSSEFIPFLERFVRERDARVRRVCVGILRWLGGLDRARASFAAMSLTAVERQELEAVLQGKANGPG